MPTLEENRKIMNSFVEGRDDRLKKALEILYKIIAGDKDMQFIIDTAKNQNNEYNQNNNETCHCNA